MGERGRERGRERVGQGCSHQQAHLFFITSTIFFFFFCKSHMGRSLKRRYYGNPTIQEVREPSFSQSNASMTCICLHVCAFSGI